MLARRGLLLSLATYIGIFVAACGGSGLPTTSEATTTLEPTITPVLASPANQRRPAGRYGSPHSRPHIHARTGAHASAYTNINANPNAHASTYTYTDTNARDHRSAHDH